MATRNQRKSKNPESPRVSSSNKRVENSWMLLLKSNLLDNDNFNIITLPHPANGTAAKYCLDDINKKIYEVITFNEPYRSWFIGETVKSDGSIQMITPVNTLFLVLPRLKSQCRSKAVPLEDLLSEKGFDKIIEYIQNMDKIGDLKGNPSLKAYKYNEDKTLEWLEERVRNVAKVLKEKNIHVTPGVASATFIASNISNNDIDDEFFLKYANGIVSEYLDDDLADALEKRFNFKSDLIESIGKKRKSECEQNGITKKFKSENEENDIKMLNSPFQVSNEIKKPKVLTAKEKARQKAASGTKTISAFFTKK